MFRSNAAPLRSLPMPTASTIAIAAIIILAASYPSFAEPADALDAATPGVITEGSGNTSIGGQPAARVGDATDTGDAIVEGSPNVTINGKPAAVLGGRTGCGGVTIGGASNVFINGKPAARAGDLTTGCERQ